MIQYFNRKKVILGIAVFACIQGFLAVFTPFWGGFLHKYFGLFCHQMPERCLVIMGHRCEVCARCLGIYLGVSLGAVLFYQISNHPFKSKVFSIATVIAVISVVLKLLNIDSSNGVRFFFGICLGIALLKFLDIFLEKVFSFFTKTLIYLERKL